MSATLIQGQIGESRSKLHAFAAGSAAPLPVFLLATETFAVATRAPATLP
jgi:hypothetical protein